MLPTWLLLYNCWAALAFMLPEYKRNPALRSHLPPHPGVSRLTGPRGPQGPLIGEARLAGTEARGRDDSAAAYTGLLRSELLGLEPSPSPVVSPPAPGSGGGPSPLRGSPPASPHRGNALRFQSPRRGPVSPRGGQPLGQRFSVDSPFSRSPLGGEEPPGASEGAARRAHRRIARSPFKVLDAPQLADDFYLNLVDWSASNVLAVGLGSCVYLWSACTSRVTTLCDLGPGDQVCSVAWSQRGQYLAVGTSLGMAQIWDCQSGRRQASLPGHATRVGALAWNSHVLASGSRDRQILLRDVRDPGQPTRLSAHRSEVCGLKWSYDDRELASGGNDNQLLIWSTHSPQPRHCFSEHTAAVKAIAWSPHAHGLLASGGGTADKCIRFWNTATDSALGCVDTGSQVCNLVWSRNVNELASTHGFSQNQIVVWRYPGMSKLATLTGHQYRVLYLAISPDGQTIVTGAGDETLRFWNVFPGQRQQGANDSASWPSEHTQIR